MATNNVINQSNPASVSDGGTGIDTMGVAYGVLCSGATATSPLLVTSPGTAGQVLTSNGNAASPTYQNVGAGTGAWVLISTQDAASSATVDFANLLTNTYRLYMVVGYNITFQTATDQFWCRIGTGAGPTWKSGGTDYAYGVDGYSSAGAAVNSASTGAAQVLLATSVSATTDLPSSIMLNIFDPSNVSYKTPITAELNVTNNSTTLVERSVAASYLTAEAITSIRFLMSSGNIETGKFQLWGLNGS